MNIKTDVISISDLADQLGISRRTIERWHAERIGPPRIKLGKLVYYRLDAVEQWMKANEQEEPRAKKLPGRASR